MIKEIVKDTDFLSQPSEPATAEDAAVAQDLVDTMESMKDDCACLAANQIGVAKAIIAFDDDGSIAVMYNPKVKQAMRPFGAIEGCLSLDKESNVTRYQTVKVAYDELTDGELVPRQRKLTDWTAQVVQHAIDHCRGRLV